MVRPSWGKRGHSCDTQEDNNRKFQSEKEGWTFIVECVLYWKFEIGVVIAAPCQKCGHTVWGALTAG